MIIVRGARPEANFTIIANDVLRDSRLSFRSRGVLNYVLSFPDGFKVSADRIAENGKEGRDALRASLKELESAGYLSRKKGQDASGHWTTELYITDAPTTDFQSSVFQSSETRPSVSQALIKQEDVYEDEIHTPTVVGESVPTAQAKEKKPSEVVIVEPAIDKKILATWKAIRTKKKAGPITDIVWAAIEREAALAGMTPEQAITRCCEEDWRGFKADWVKPKPVGYQPPEQPKPASSVIVSPAPAKPRDLEKHINGMKMVKQALARKAA